MPIITFGPVDWLKKGGAFLRRKFGIQHKGLLTVGDAIADEL